MRFPSTSGNGEESHFIQAALIGMCYFVDIQTLNVGCETNFQFLGGFLSVEVLTVFFIENQWQTNATPKEKYFLSQNIPATAKWLKNILLQQKNIFSYGKLSE
jgi:hypothetical protein